MIFSKVHEFVQSSVFSPISARFVIFALATPLFSVFSKVHEFVRNRSFQSELRKFCYFCTGALLFKPFLAKCTSLYKTVFLARDDHVFSFSNWAHHFLALFSKAHEFVQNSAFSPRSARFVIFAVGHTTLFCFQQSARLLRKQKFSAQDQNVLSFSHWVHYFLAIFSKVHEYVQNSLYSPRLGRFVIFALGAPRFSDFQQSVRVCSKVHEYVQNSLYSPRLGRFVIFALGAPRFSDFQQSVRVCTKQRFLKEISTFCHFCPGYTTF